MNWGWKIARRSASLILATLTFVLAAIASSPAVAAEYTMRPCANFNTAAEWFPAAGSGELVDQCPFGMLLQQNDGSSPESQTRWEFGGHTPVREATIEASGSDGSDSSRRHGLALCNWEGECGPPVSLSGPAVTTPETLSLDADDPLTPPGADRLAIVSDCLDTNFGCPTGAGMKIHSLSVTFDDPDSSPPEVSIQLLDYPEPYEEPFGPWVKSPLRYEWTAVDEQSGIKSGFFRTSSITRPGISDPCVDQSTGEIVDFCALYSGEIDKSADISSLNQGDNNALLARAVNGAGVTGEKQLPIRVDTIAPARPASLRVAGSNLHGWSTSNVVSLSWANLGETEEDFYHSGLVKARYRLPGQEPLEVDIAGTSSTLLQDIEVTEQHGTTEVTVWVIDRAGNVSLPGYVDVMVDDQRPAAPEVEPIPVIGAGNIETASIEWTSQFPIPASGTCWYAVSATSSADSDPGTAMLLDTSVVSITAARLLTPSSKYVHVRAISCAGVEGLVTHVPVTVDLTPPAVSVTPDGAKWRSTPTTLALDATDVGTGVTSIEYVIDGGTATVVPGDHAAVVLPAGVHTVSYSAIDAAGNRSAPQDSVQRVDVAPPTAWFEPADPARPVEVKAAVTDAQSGIVSAWIEYRPAAGGPWAAIGERFSPVEGKPTATLRADFPDDETVTPGEYQLRVVAYDAVGNVVAATDRQGGAAAIVVSPLRRPSSLSAAFAKTTKPGHAGIFAYGGAAQLSGRLLTEGGLPVASVSLAVLTAPVEGGAFARDGEVVTGDDGSFWLSTRARTSRVIKLRFAGDAANRPVSATITLRVKGRVSLKTPRRSIKRGGVVVLRGRVSTGGAAVPLAGKQIRIEFRGRRGWSEFSSPSTTDAAGGFAAPLRLTARAVYRLRVSVPAEPGWPFEPVKSRAVTVRVR